MTSGATCFYCKGEPETGWIEIDNNGPIVPCPVCNPKTDREIEYDRAEAARAAAPQPAPAVGGWQDPSCRRPPLMKETDMTQDKARGWCREHYERFQHNGDPLRGQQRRGAALRYFLDVVLSYEGDDCLLWPFKRATNGYARLWYEGRYQNVSRLACVEENGPPPTTSHEAAHLCGMGHEACVTRSHTAWKTPKENAADKVVHGTINRGERHGNSRLTEADARAILSLKGTPQAEIAKRFGVSVSNVSAIQCGKAWSWII